MSQPITKVIIEESEEIKTDENEKYTKLNLHTFYDSYY